VSDFGFFLFLTIVLVLFVGEPDLHDKLLEHASGCSLPAKATP
jgi:hypothetical protein